MSTMPAGQNHPETPLEQFGSRVRNNRLRSGLSQEQLALVAGLDRTYVSGIEKGKRNIGLVNLLRIAHALDTTASELLAGIDHRPAATR